MGKEDLYKLYEIGKRDKPNGFMDYNLIRLFILGVSMSLKLQSLVLSIRFG